MFFWGGGGTLCWCKTNLFHFYWYIFLIYGILFLHIYFLSFCFSVCYVYKQCKIFLHFICGNELAIYIYPSFQNHFFPFFIKNVLSSHTTNKSAPFYRSLKIHFFHYFIKNVPHNKYVHSSTDVWLPDHPRARSIKMFPIVPTVHWFDQIPTNKPNSVL